MIALSNFTRTSINVHRRRHDLEPFSTRRAIRFGGACLVAPISFAVAIAFGQGTASDEQKKMLTVEGSLNLRTVADLQFSGDGARLAFVVTEAAKGTGRLRHI